MATHHGHGNPPWCDSGGRRKGDSRTPSGRFPVAVDDSTSPWITAPRGLVKALRKLSAAGDPAYEAHAGVYSGANGIYWVMADGEANDSRQVPVTNLNDIGKTRIPKRYGRIEEELLHPLVRGADVSRWSAVPWNHILFVQDPDARVGIAETMRDQFPGALGFLGQFESLLRKRRGLRSILGDRTGAAKGLFWSMFGVGPYTLAKYKVVWKDQASDFAAAVLSGGWCPFPTTR